MDSRCTGPSSTIMWDTHSPKSRESLLYYGSHCYTHRRRRPPPRTRGGPERTSATPRPTTRVRDRSHAHANRTRGGPDRIHRQLVTGRRYTGLTVTFSRPTEAPLEPPTGSEEQSSRSFPTSTVSLSRLGLAHHPHRAGAGAGSALTCTTEAAALTQRSHLYRLRCTRLPALRTRPSWRPLHLAGATQDHAAGEGVDTDGGSDRLSLLGPCGSATHVRAAACAEAPGHSFSACAQRVTFESLGGQEWADGHG